MKKIIALCCVLLVSVAAAFADWQYTTLYTPEGRKVYEGKDVTVYVERRAEFADGYKRYTFMYKICDSKGKQVAYLQYTSNDAIGLIQKYSNIME
jgi:hypothetical protein